MFHQYQFLRQQSDKLFELQEEYRSYLLKLRSVVDDLQKMNDQDQPEVTASVEKKKSFLTVNRKPEYLRQSLVHYLKEHKLERELKELRRRNYIPRVLERPQRKPKSRTRMRYAVPRENFGIMRDLADRITKEISFVWPLDLHTFRISSRFGPRKKVGGAPGFHYGIDLAAWRGIPVKASAAGEVIEAGYAPGYGNTVVIAHSKKYKTRYAHLDAINTRTGTMVQQDEKIGTVGSTGVVRGKYPWHLHFEVYVGKNRINPLWVLPKIK